MYITLLVFTIIIIIITIMIIIIIVISWRSSRRGLRALLW